MQAKTPTECPKCGRPLQQFNGHIGYCPQHKWVSPSGLGFEAEATEQNKKDEAAVKAQRLEEERRKLEGERKIQQKRHAAAVRRGLVVVVALCALAAAVVLLVIRPSANYASANERFAEGDYAAAQSAFASLGGYKDSAARAMLSEAMLDLLEGRAEDAVDKLDRLTNDGAGDAAKQLSEAMLPVMADWKARGLSPEALLMLLDRSGTIDPDGTLDEAALRVEAHAAMLPENVLKTFADDMDGDGDAELAALDSGYAVTVYRMTANGNVRMAVDNETAAACQMRFGGDYQKADPDAAVACYSEAYRLLPDDETRAALTGAYRLRAQNRENAGDMEAALADARSAMETSGAAEDFSFFYEMNLRRCKNGHDAAAAIALWDGFARDCESELARFGARERWNADAAQLHLARAAELAAQTDEGCVDEIRAAAEMGADVADAIAVAQSHFEPGLSLARLRVLELELSGGDAGGIRSAMASEIRAAVSEWKSRGVSPADVPALIRLADEQNVDLDGIDRDSIYHEAALACATSASQSEFVNWDGDGYDELLTLDGDGKLSLWAADETWSAVAAMDTRLSEAGFAIVDGEAPLILALSGAGDELLVLAGSDRGLNALFRETDICRYAADGGLVTFSRRLDGSIERYDDYTYRAVNAGSRPERTGVDWQQNDYPEPENGAAAVLRCLETRTYDVDGELELLTAGVQVNGFAPEELSGLPAPDDPGAATIQAYSVEADRELYEVAYVAGGQSVRVWMAAVREDGWRIAGAAQTYAPGMDAEAPDYTVPLLSVNAQTTDTIQERGGRRTYRLMLSSSGSLSMLWQAGEKAVSRTAFAVSLYRDSLSGDPVISYELQPSAARQQTKPMFMSAGVYYVTVEARTADAISYNLCMQMESAEHVELENNDVSAAATPVETGVAYTGSLLTQKDVDWYAFEIDAASEVNVQLGTSGSGSKTAAYAMSVYGAQDGAELCTVSAPGNVQASETGALYLAAGTYWVRIARGSTWINEAYSLTVTALQNGVMEAESNNTLETANPVPVNEDVHASFGREGDVDFFSFELDADAVVQPRLTFNPTDSNSKTYVITLYGANRAELMKINVGGKESAKVVAPIALKAGTYAVKVENPRFVQQEYALRLVCMTVDAAESEPNDSVSLANALTPGAPVTGVLTTEDDVDVYKVVFEEQTTVTLSFSYPQSTVTGSVFSISVEQNGRSQSLANLTGDSGGTELPLTFMPGEYYLKIKAAGAWSSAVYTLELK